MHAEHRFGEAATPSSQSRVGTSVIAASAQRRWLTAAQQQTPGSLQTLIDRLPCQMPVGPHRELAAQRTADLRRAPALRQKAFDRCQQLRVSGKFRQPRSPTPQRGGPVSLEGLVLACGRAIAVQLPAYRGRGAVDRGGDRAHRVSGAAAVGDLDPFGLGEESRRYGLCGSGNLPQDCWIRVPAVQPLDKSVLLRGGDFLGELKGDPRLRLEEKIAEMMGLM